MTVKFLDCIFSILITWEDAAILPMLAMQYPQKPEENTLVKKLVLDSIEKAKELDFLILQFNAVVEDNFSARHLYEKLGFKQLGVIPKGFRLDNDEFVNICPYYIEL